VPPLGFAVGLFDFVARGVGVAGELEALAVDLLAAAGGDPGRAGASATRRAWSGTTAPPGSSGSAPCPTLAAKPSAPNAAAAQPRPSRSSPA